MTEEGEMPNRTATPDDQERFDTYLNGNFDDGSRSSFNTLWMIWSRLVRFSSPSKVTWVLALESWMLTMKFGFYLVPSGFPFALRKFQDVTKSEPGDKPH
jgi:hypothetical protein